MPPAPTARPTRSTSSPTAPTGPRRPSRTAGSSQASTTPRGARPRTPPPTARARGAAGSPRPAASRLAWSGICAGEAYDARAERPGWDTAGFDDAAWSPVAMADAGSVRPNLVAQAGPPIRVDTVLRPVRRTNPKPGVYI